MCTSTKSIEKIKIVLAYTQQTKRKFTWKSFWQENVEKGKSNKRYIFVTMTCIKYYIYEQMLYI